MPLAKRKCILARNGLDRGVEDLGPLVAAPEAGRVDPDRSLRPCAQESLGVLLDQFTHMDEEDDAHRRELLDQALRQSGKNDALAGACRHVDQRISTPVRPIVEDG